MKSPKTAISLMVASAVLATGSVHAQVSQSGFMLEEVMVTARKREENLQSTPIAVSAFTGNELENRQITSTDQLSEVTPNLTFDSVSPASGSSSAGQIFIRGIGQTDFTPVTDPGVGLYIDGVYMARSVGAVLDFLDVERIEILRGPQGTLFGRNTIGGAISIFSKKPDEELAGSGKVEVGDDDMFNATVKANVPITDKLLSNVAITSRYRDGYVERVYDGVKTGDEDRVAGRASLLWDASDNLEVFFTADGTRIRENGAPAVTGGINDVQAFGTFGNGLLASCDAVAINPNFDGSRAGGPPSFPPPGVGAGGAPGCVGPDTFSGKHTSLGTFPVRSRLDMWGVSGEVAWQANDWLSIKSISGYRDMDMKSSRDGDNTPANIFATEDFYDQWQVSQEFQFSGTLLEDRLNWLFGLYYFKEEGTDSNPVYLPVGSISSGGGFENESKAVFFQSTYDLTEKWSLTGGVRYTEDDKGFIPGKDQISLGDASASGFFGNTWPNFAGFYLQSGGGPPLAAGERLVPDEHFKKKFDDTNIMGNVAYQWTDDVMAYATYSQGYKSGGFDQRITGFTEEPSSYDPETVDSYEVGLKSDLFDSRVRLNLAVFHTDYDDLQIIIREGFNPITYNGGNAEIDGAELELTWVPTDRWYINGAVGYIDASYKELDPSVTSAENATPIDINNQLVNTPEWSAALGAAYTLDFSDWATVTPRVDWSYHDDEYNDALNDPRLYQDSYHLLNASIVMETNDGRWESMLGFQNITDEEYLITGTSAWLTSAAYVEQVYARGASWSLYVQYNFR
ncbi:MAG: TonB-dependent receptor [Pseudomonadales bacterium]|nr:TonB-dependent receptor [Halioglobus sp.]MCP5193795.1 TonB-dependent receptor [Pseudomonadales bacterium]